VRGFAVFFSLCFTVAALMVIPPAHARWIALALLVLVALTPAVGPGPKTRRSSRSEKASSAMHS
jgi:hypothetical protein